METMKKSRKNKMSYITKNIVKPKLIIKSQNKGNYTGFAPLHVPSLAPSPRNVGKNSFKSKSSGNFLWNKNVVDGISLPCCATLIMPFAGRLFL